MTPVYLFCAAVALAAALAWLHVPCAIAYVPIVAFALVAVWRRVRG